MRTTEIAERINESAETLFRTPDGWASMERHDLPGTPRNLVFSPVQPVTKMTNEELIDAMRRSYVAEVKQLVSRITGVDIE